LRKLCLNVENKVKNENQFWEELLKHQYEKYKHIMFILIRLLIELDRFKSYIQTISEQSIQFESKRAIYLKLF
jgi:hypothetical protein